MFQFYVTLRRGRMNLLHFVVMCVRYFRRGEKSLLLLPTTRRYDNCTWHTQFSTSFANIVSPHTIARIVSALISWVLYYLHYHMKWYYIISYIKKVKWRKGSTSWYLSMMKHKSQLPGTEICLHIWKSFFFNIACNFCLKSHWWEC